MFIQFNCALTETNLYARSFALGSSQMEEGDNLRKFGTQIQIISHNKTFHFDYVPMKMGPITKKTILLNLSKQIKLPKFQKLKALVGFSSLVQHTQIVIPTMNIDDSETSYNLGVNYGLSFDIKLMKSLSFFANWNSHIFPAGLASLLLVTGRKEIIALGIGLSL